MCGICGFVNINGAPADRSILERMNRGLVHRGPDDVGVFVDGAAALAMRRLAIIDLEGGQQPIANEDATVLAICNGEIYNSPEVRRGLQNRGHRFSTRSDTEVLVHAYEEVGKDVPREMRGMFALAILDLGTGQHFGKKLLLARDRMGIKPLYYYIDDRLLAFSSELTSLVQHPGIRRELEPSALRQCLSTGIVASPLTMFKSVFHLLPGQILFLQDGKIKIETYWHLPKQCLNPAPPLAEMALETRRLLENAVKEHLLSDVPVGAFLSGGIDSSTVVAIAAGIVGKALPTFTIRFEEEGYDESAFARLVASCYNTDHHEFTIPNKGFNQDILLTMLTHHGQPTADSSAIPTFIVSRLARERVKVVLSGDGGDECFGGYSHFGWVRTIDKLYSLPKRMRLLSASVTNACTFLPGLRQSEGLRHLNNALKASLAQRQLLPLEVIKINSENEIGALLAPDFCPDVEGSLWADLFSDNVGCDPVGQAQRIAFRYFLPDAYLAKVDRMSMANALEVRVPFLDHRLVEYALAIPGNLHWKGGVGKQVLRRAVTDLLPEEIFTHRKQGFSIPLHHWTTSAYFELAEELLSEKAVKQRGLFRPEEVRRLLNRCQSKISQRHSVESDYRQSHRLLILIMIELWCRLYLDTLVDRPTEATRWDGQIREERVIGRRKAAN